MLQLRPHQVYSIDELRKGFAMGYRVQMLYAPCAAGKCLAFDTPVIMANGEIKKVQDVAVGDQLLSPDGSVRNVLSLARGREMMYRVTPSKGDPYVVNAGHILSLRKIPSYDGMVLSDGSKVSRNDDVVNVNVEIFYKSNATVKSGLKGWRSEALEFSRAKDKLLLDPYWLGCWLGDGLSRVPAICKPASTKMVQWWIEHAESEGYSVTKYQYSESECPCWNIVSPDRNNKFTAGLNEYNLIKNKHIPDAYKYSSINDRLRLLAGLIDSDGSVDRKGYDWITKYEHLAEQFAFVCRSVGLSAYVKKCQKDIKNSDFTGTYWRVFVSGDVHKIPCLDKPIQNTPRLKRHLVHGIKVEPIGEGDYFGFTLDGDKLFLLGDFTVTHNTEIAVAMMAGAAEKGKYCSILVDLTLLCAQTSARLAKYDIDHGIIQPKSPRYRPDLPIQVCMVQTLEARNGFPKVDLMIIDEAHMMRHSVIEFIRNNPQVKVVGLSASPFTKGLASIYSNVVSACTVNDLVSKGLLINPRVFIAKQVDMTGATKVAGEWSDKEATERGIKITGDVVAEWITKTTEVFGEPRKTIVFSASVAHGADLSEKFAAAGYNFISVSYKDDDEYKKQVLADFARPDTEIHGLIATDLLTKGFDVTDVCIGVSARPFSKSFSAHVQQLGRIMRTHEGKEQAIWLDHSGNYLRFKDQWDYLCGNGVKELDDGAEKTKPEPSYEQKEAAKCPKCGCLWNSATDICAHCGFVRMRRSDVITVAGSMSELNAAATKKDKYSPEYKREFYAQLLGYCQDTGKKDGFAFYKYKEKFGVQPAGAKPSAQKPKAEVLAWIKSRQIAFAKAKKAA